MFFFHLQRLIKSDLLTTTATTSVRARIIVCRSCPAIVVLLGRASSQLLTLPLFSCALLNWVVWQLSSRHCPPEPQISTCCSALVQLWFYPLSLCCRTVSCVGPVLHFSSSIEVDYQHSQHIIWRSTWVQVTFNNFLSESMTYLCILDAV